MASGSQNMTTHKAKQLVNTYGSDTKPVYINAGVPTILGTIGGQYDPVWVNSGVVTAITAGTTGQFYRGDKTWSNTLNGTFTANSTITANGGYLKSTLNSNTVTIGSQNTSFCHIESSANIPFWFNRSIYMDQGTTIGAAGTQYRPFQLYLGRYSTTSGNALNTANPLIEFSNGDRSQYCQLMYDDHDSLVDPDSLTLVGNQNGIKFILKNGPLWIQGGSNAGGNINRLTTSAGMPGNMQYNVSRRGTQIYANGIAFADPYNGNSNSDAGWIRHQETTSNAGELEIAVGDDGNETIVVRQYNTSNAVVRTLTLLSADGYTFIPSYLNIGGHEKNASSPTYVWGSNSSDSYLRSYQTSKLSVATSASCTGNAATATTLQTARNIWGQSFNGSANITGKFLLQDDGSLAIYTVDGNAGCGNETVVIQSCFDGVDPQSHSYVSSYSGRCNIAMQPRGGQVFIGGVPANGNTKTYKLYVAGRIQNSNGYLDLSGTASKCPDGTAITQPGGANALELVSYAASGRDCGIFHISNDNAYICNSSDNNYTFAVFDTDLTQDFSAADNASFVVLSNGGGVKCPRGNFIGNVTGNCSGSSGSCTGNAATATKLATARAINGTNFDGSAAITTANWGTARTLTIGATGKSVNGGGNVSWSMSEIMGSSDSTKFYRGDKVWSNIIANEFNIVRVTTNWKTGATLNFYTTSGSTTGYSYIASYQTPTATTYNDSLVIVATGGCFIGGGEGAETIHQNVMSGSGTEDLYLCPDGVIRIYTGADNKKQRAIFDDSSQFYPATNNTGAIGTSGNKWANMYATTFHGALDGTASAVGDSSTSWGSANLGKVSKVSWNSSVTGVSAVHHIVMFNQSLASVWVCGTNDIYVTIREGNGWVQHSSSSGSVNVSTWGATFSRTDGSSSNRLTVRTNNGSNASITIISF